MQSNNSNNKVNCLHKREQLGVAYLSLFSINFKEHMFIITKHVMLLPANKQNTIMRFNNETN